MAESSSKLKLSSKEGAKVEATKESSALELLEEDDEFEEFEGASWEELDRQGEDKQLWQDDWDDDDVNDEFTQQLREQIENNST